MRKDNLDISSLRELLIYYPGSGRLFWRYRPLKYFSTERACRAWNSRFAGRAAFTFVDIHGYLCSEVFQRKNYAHRVAFALHYGRWPRGEVDHKNRNRADNRIDNLREFSRAENMRNTGLRSTNKSGIKGVSWSKRERKWRAQITVNGENRHLGAFARKADAAAARRAVEKGIVGYEGTERVLL